MSSCVVDGINIVRGLALFLGVAGLALGQDPPAAPDAPSAIKVRVEVVNVLCDVYDQKGALITNLHKEDFKIQENGRPQEIRYFAQESNLPLTLALLIDVSGSVRTIIDEEKVTASSFLERILRQDDQALLLSFASNVILWQDFTSSPAALHTALVRLRAVPVRGLQIYSRFAGTLLYDAVYLTASEKLNDVKGRKAVVIISDGVDTGSQTKLMEAVQALQDTNTITYGICYQPPGGESGCSYLKDLAVPTGGRSFTIGKKTPLSKIFQTIEDEIRSQYAIGYISTNQAHDGTFRKIQVKTKSGSLRVQTRKGYYAAKE